MQLLNNCQMLIGIKNCKSDKGKYFMFFELTYKIKIIGIPIEKYYDRKETVVHFSNKSTKNKTADSEYLTNIKLIRCFLRQLWDIYIHSQTPETFHLLSVSLHLMFRQIPLSNT